MKGIQYVTDEDGNRTAVQIDLKEWGSLWEDLCDIIVAESRKGEETISWEDLKKEMADDQSTQNALHGWVQKFSGEGISVAPHPIESKISDAIDHAVNSPSEISLLKLKGGQRLCRIREGDFRIIFTIDFDKRLITIMRIRHRKDAYRRF